MTKKAIYATVERIKPLSNTILQVFLNPEHYIDYKPGQYLQILIAGKEYSYSIANAPLGSHKYELHIRHSQDNDNNQKLLAQIKQKGALSIRLPEGHCHLEQLQADKPILFIAGGTGFAPIKAMIEQLLASDDQRTFELFWLARSQSDLYMDEMVRQWQAHVEHFQYVSLLSNPSKEALVAQILAHSQGNLANWQIVLGGPFDMVYAIRDLLLAEGLLSNQLFSDAFSFEKTKGE